MRKQRLVLVPIDRASDLERSIEAGRRIANEHWQNSRVADDLARRSPVPVLVLPTRETPGRDEFRLRRIVTPVDFSAASAAALRTAAELSRRHGARVTLVHALGNVPGQMVLSGSAAWQAVRRLPARRDAVASRLRRKAALFGMNDVDTEVATGDAGRAILEVATRRQADMVVMGIAQRSLFDRVLFGSNLRRVLRRTTLPVLVVPAVAPPEVWVDEPVVDDQIRSRAWTDSAVHRIAA